jgi:hypothetical protein
MDVLLLETFNGGDVNKIGNDVALAYGFENMPYLAMFGGNDKSTPSRRVEGEQNFDWWGNAYEVDSVVQINSNTERVLRSVSLNSSGRVQIEQAVNSDLEFIRSFANVEVSVSIISDDRVQIDINIIEPRNLQNRSFRYIWDGLEQRLGEIGSYVPPPTEPIVNEGIFDFTFDNTFN